MNLYRIEYEEYNKSFFVVADSGDEALNKLQKYLEETGRDEQYYRWKKIINFANNWNDDKIGIFE